MVSVLDFLSARSACQREAFEHISTWRWAPTTQCIDTLIGDIQAPPDLMRTQTDRKIADELQRTYDAQRDAEIKRQTLARETAIADMQAEVVRSEQLVAIAQTNATAVIEQAKGDAESRELRGAAEAEALRAIGTARADTYRAGREALGESAYTAIQVATVLGEAKVKLVPDIAVGGSGDGSSSRLADVLIGRMLATGTNGKPPA